MPEGVYVTGAHWQALKAKFNTLKEANPADIRDFHIYGGLIMSGYGLFLLYPWLSFTVIGLILFIMGAPFPGRRSK